jgi:2-oxoglutarate dehydrogenase E1 component
MVRPNLEATNPAAHLDRAKSRRADHRRWHYRWYMSINSRALAATSTEQGDGTRKQILDAFRRWGYLQATLDPLGRLAPAPVPDLDVFGDEGAFARRFYCGPIGAEFMHIPDPDQRRWIQEQLEGEPPRIDSYAVLERLISAELVEDVLHARYPGTKRFSLEGATALIPLLDEILTSAAAAGAIEVMLGMSHRGRLNVMVHIVGKDPVDIFSGFEDADPRSVLGGGDVKYHLGASGTYHTRDGKPLAVQLVSNPSHLEAVYPVVLGRARARQVRLDDGESTRVVPVVLHGDGAFAGQGIVAETLNLTELTGFKVGGTIHVVVNNLIGFTTDPADLHSTRFATDVAKRLPVPILHVNGEDVGAVVRAGQFAAEYRRTFKSDVVIDLIGYRRYGHSEVDDPTVTHPTLYARLKDHLPMSRQYAAQIGADVDDLVRVKRNEFHDAQESAATRSERRAMSQPAEYWNRYRGGCYRPEYDVDTAVAANRLQSLGERLTRVPSDFHLHPKMRRLLQQRSEMVAGKRPIDFGMAEALAFATLLDERVPVRLSGQDSIRGTFSHRHAVLVDTVDERRCCPLAQTAVNGARFEVYNSPLSEAAVLGFEYGYSRDYPETLVLWEAQFGDFANNAQVIIDQFIASAEDKWRRLSGLTLLLPHGYEGQGPEHSSARVERFLQLAAEDNLQICLPSTAVQYFHVLRRQALTAWRTPLVIFTPKSMLRHSSSSSPIPAFAEKRFLRVLADIEVRDARRVLLCTGKIGHELRAERARRADDETAIVSVEQLMPFPSRELATECGRYPNAKDFVWVQEEPANMGARAFMMPRLRRLLDGRPVRSVRRSASASPATGSAKAHDIEQQTLLAMAFGT